MGLAGKGKIAVMMTSTPIAPDDLTCKIKEDVNWHTTVWPCIIQYPRDIKDNPDEGLWATYFRLYDAENTRDESHDESLAYYRDHKAQMDEGAEVFNPTRFLQSDGHISAI